MVSVGMSTSTLLWPCVLVTLLLAHLLTTNISSLLFLLGLLASSTLGIASYLLLRLHFDQSYFDPNQTFSSSFSRSLLRHQEVALRRGRGIEKELKLNQVQLKIASRTLFQLSDEILDRILDDYVLYWFDHLLPPLGRMRVRSVLRVDLVHCINNFCDRLATIDLVTLAVNVLNMLTRHFEALRCVEGSKKGRSEGIKRSFKLKSHLANNETELDYLTTLAETLIVLCFPKRCSRSRATRSFLKHTLATHVLKPLIDLVTMPDFINTKTARFIQRANRQQQRSSSKSNRGRKSQENSPSGQKRMLDDAISGTLEKFVSSDVESGKKVINLTKLLRACISHDEEDSVDFDLKLQDIQRLIEELCLIDEQLRLNLQAFKMHLSDKVNKTVLRHISKVLHKWMQTKWNEFIESTTQSNWPPQQACSTQTLREEIETLENRIDEIKELQGSSTVADDEMQLVMSQQLRSAEVALLLLKEQESVYTDLWLRRLWKCAVNTLDNDTVVNIHVFVNEDNNDEQSRKDKRAGERSWSVDRDPRRTCDALSAVLSRYERDRFITQQLKLLHSPKTKISANIESVLNAILADPRFRHSEEVCKLLLPMPNFDGQMINSDVDALDDDIEDERDRFTASSSGDSDLGAAADAVYRLVGEVFDLRGVFRLLRKSLMTFVQITYGSSMGRKVRDVSLWLASESMIAYYLHCFKKAYWPTQERPVDMVDPETTKQLLLENLPEMLTTLVGHQTAVMGTIKVFDAFQNEKLNKHLFYTLIEIVLIQLCPELQQQESSSD